MSSVVRQIAFLILITTFTTSYAGENRKEVNRVPNSLIANDAMNVGSWPALRLEGIVGSNPAPRDGSSAAVSENEAKPGSAEAMGNYGNNIPAPQENALRRQLPYGAAAF